MRHSNHPTAQEQLPRERTLSQIGDGPPLTPPSQGGGEMTGQVPSGQVLSRRNFLAAAGLVGMATGMQAGRVQSGQSGRNQGPGSAGRAIYLTDLDQCRPSAALSQRSKRGAWRTLGYETESFSGTMLVAIEESEAPEITYSVERAGWHQILIGIYRKPFKQSFQVQVKLTDDPAFTTLTGRRGETDHQENWIDDVYWKTADLTGRGITLRQILLPAVQHAWVAYIKLVPLSDTEVKALQVDRNRTDTKRLFVHTDAHFSDVTGSALELRNHLEPLRHSDASRVYWEAGSGDRALYFSKIARDYSSSLQDATGERAVFPRKIDRKWAETWRAYRNHGVDPLRVAVDFTHEIGIELHAAYRAAGFVYPPPHDGFHGSFYERNSKLVCVARDGTKLPRISYAFPETRRYVISLFREMAAYPIDGVCVLYNRRPPLVAYEAPLVEGFRSRYGKDPRKLDENDPRWLSYRSGVLTQFMRELRQEMDAVAKQQKRAKRLEISAVVCRNDENLLHGMDLKTWIQEGLVDTIIPYSSSVRLNSYEPAWEKPEDVADFVSLVKGTNCCLAPNLMPRALTPEQYRRKAHLLYQAGVENLFFWDGINRVRQASRLGHQKEIEAWVAAGEPPIVPTSIRLRKLGPWDLRTETPG